MTKKSYNQPALEVEQADMVLPIASSLRINNEVINDTEGDVKEEYEWNIWED